MKKRTLIKIVSFSLAAFALAAGFAAKYRLETQAYRRAETYGAYLAMSELADAAEGMSKAFQAAVYAESPALTASISNEIWLRSAQAAQALARLPVADAQIEETRIFLSRAGDYAAYLSRAAARQESPDGEKAALGDMAAAAQRLSDSLRQLEGDVYAGNVLFSGAVMCNNGALFRFGDIEESGEYPNPDYEGLYSQTYLSRAPSMLADAAPCTAQQAAPLAAAALGCAPDAPEYGGESGGRIACHVFRLGEDEAYITVRGGYLARLNRQERETAQEAFSASGQEYEALLADAEQALDALGFPDMTPLRAVGTQDGIEAVFAARENGVRCDPDTVRVVYGAEGGILQLGAEAYLEHHRVRGVREPAQSGNDALPASLSMTCVGAAVIDSGFGSEYLCREYRAALDNGRELTVFCDAHSGEQRKIELRDPGE